MRYLKQRDQYSCGPVAIANAMKWAGSKESASKIRKRFIQECKCSPKHNGCYTDDLEEALCEADLLEFERINWPGLDDLDKHLDGGGVVLLRIRHEHGGHYFLCTRRTPKMYEVVNYKRIRNTTCKISRETMRKDLEFTDGGPGCMFFAVAWMINKNEDRTIFEEGRSDSVSQMSKGGSKAF